MGANLSAIWGGSRHKETTGAASNSSSNIVHEQSDSRVLPDFIGAHSRLLAPALFTEIVDALPEEHRRTWKMLYSSMEHGKSYTQMLRRIVRRGPTVIIFREADGRTVGCYTASEWITSGDQAHAAKLRAAERAKYDSTGGESGGYTRKPRNQAPQYFGDSRCFVFTSGEGKPRVYTSKPHNNSNFMYLCDTLQGDKGGLGMGSTKENTVGDFAWFIDSTLSRGRCSIDLCPTFSNPRLTSKTEFSIEAVEVFGVDEESWGPEPEDGENFQPLSKRHGVDAALMELNGHRFYSEQGREECC